MILKEGGKKIRLTMTLSPVGMVIDLNRRTDREQVMKTEKT